ncbi:exportin-5-like [Argonauta hians]
MDKDVQQLIAAVETVMNPAVRNEDRMLAHKVCDELKEMPSKSIEFGLILAHSQYSPIIRHFGLQLLEHCIKYHWNDLVPAEKNRMKKSALELIATGTQGILVEVHHIKDAVSRITVEIIKRDWPQLWGTLLKDLEMLSLQGETQTELVLLVFLRVVEDVITFQNIPQQRRREIQQTLTANLGDLFKFFLGKLTYHKEQYQTLQQSPEREYQLRALIHCRVCDSVLHTLCGFVEWVPMFHILDNNSLLLRLLCLLLNDKSLQLMAVECLLLIVSRKGRLEERKPLLILFSDDAMSIIFTAAIEANNSSTDERYYLFLKRLCQVFTEIGKQLCALWGFSEDVQKPPTFTKYLEAVLAFTEHPSRFLGSLTHSLWASFLRHEIISEDETLLSYVPRLVHSATTTIIKIGFPSQTKSPSCSYALLDFDSDEEFNLFFSRYRAEVAETLRLATRINPKCTFEAVANWLQDLLKKPVDIGGGTERGNCNLSSPAFLEWDGLTTFLESVMSRLITSPNPQPDRAAGVQLLKQVLDYNTQDPLILSCWLSCVSALFTFLTDSVDTLPIVLEKIFSAVIFNLPGQTKSTRSKAVKNVRQHACSVLVKVCKQYPDLLFPVFPSLYQHIQNIAKDPIQLSQMEKCILTEALILISNQSQNFDKQSTFIEEVLQPVKEIWLSSNFELAFQSPDKFMSFVGLDQPPVEPSTDDLSGINRSQISYCIITILAVMKRSKWPDDFQIAKSGGFANPNVDSSILLRNPATPHISILLNNLFAMLRTLNALWLPENLKLRHPDFCNSYDLQEVDKLAVLGIQPPYIDNTDSTISKQPVERMQNFIGNIHDNSYHILGNAGLCLGYEFYAHPTLSTLLLDYVFFNLNNIPDYRLRPIIRVFMKPYVQHCPREYFVTAVLPLLAKLCPYMYQRLSLKWAQINQRCQDSSSVDEDKEVLEDQLTRQLTREYLELLGVICMNKKSDSEDNVDDMEIVCQGAPPRDDSLSELGQMCMKTEEIYPFIFLCVYDGLLWRDSSTCHKCISLGWPVLKQMLAEKTVTAAGAHHLLNAVLLGLKLHGQHEAGQAMLLSLGLQVYEVLRPIFPDVHTVMQQQIPFCTENSLKTFDEKLLHVTPQKQSEKRKKDAFKKLVSDIIGKNLGEHFKKEKHFEKLPPIFHLKNKLPSLDIFDTSETTGLADLFTIEAAN